VLDAVDFGEVEHQNLREIPAHRRLRRTNFSASLSRQSETWY
jgi:hypothetical protein